MSEVATAERSDLTPSADECLNLFIAQTAPQNIDEFRAAITVMLIRASLRLYKQTNADTAMCALYEPYAWLNKQDLNDVGPT